eukprot:Opistho-2@93380
MGTTALRYVTVNGQPDDGVDGGGLCRSCNAGYFGKRCDATSTCVTSQGVPSEGIDGIGQCSSCKQGYVGLNCNATCTCKNGVCNDTVSGDGHCKNGTCDEGFAGSDCNECAENHFGKRCWECDACDTPGTVCNATIRGNGRCISTSGAQKPTTDSATGKSSTNITPIAAGAAAGGVLLVGAALFATYRYARREGKAVGSERTWQFFKSNTKESVRETRDSPALFLNPMHTANVSTDIQMEPMSGGVGGGSDGIQYANLAIARGTGPAPAAPAPNEYDIVRKKSEDLYATPTYDQIRR